LVELRAGFFFAAAAFVVVFAMDSLSDCRASTDKVSRVSL
jgi:hypothetical protein